ncbi:hypothetical protein TNCV_724851 [Trichonephila clavipes]|nr:hypothetical protein TNCV_724851 [Trichonephila clavipes]
MMTLNTFAATTEEESNHRNASHRNEIFFKRRMKGKKTLTNSSSRDSTGLTTETSPHTPRFEGLGTHVDVKFYDEGVPGSDTCMRRLQIRWLQLNALKREKKTFSTFDPSRQK